MTSTEQGNATHLPAWFDLSLKQELLDKKNRPRGLLCYIDLLCNYALEWIVRSPSWRYVAPYEWSELEALIEEDAREIRASTFRPDVVIGIKSGGAFISNYVARCLDVQLVGYVRVARYTPILGCSALAFFLRYFSGARLRTETDIELAGQNVLIVDDQVRTGKSLLAVRRWTEIRGAKEVRTYCMFSQGAKADFGSRDGMIVNCPWGDDP